MAVNVPSASLFPTSNNLIQRKPATQKILISPVFPSSVHSGALASNTNHLKFKRSLGQKLFDTMLYPILTNFAVFALSVYATYKTNFGKPGNWMMKRGEVSRAFLRKHFKMPKASAEMAVMLGFSFLDGCLMAPVVKLFEDHRHNFVHWIDKKMGTTPSNPEAVYARDPKQSWRSVLAGRATGVMTIVPAAVVLDRKWGRKSSLNDILFSNPGLKIGQILEKSIPSLQRKFPHLNLPGIAKVSVFEAFYTSLTTLALYLSSRFYASSRKMDIKRYTA